VDTPGRAHLRSAGRGEADVLRAILEREAAALPLNSAAVLRHDPRLHGRIVWLFGRWDAAMKAAGIDPDRVRSHRRWSACAVVKRIMQLANEGRPLNLLAIQKSEAVLASAAFRYFASWDEALEAAGLDPREWRKRLPKWAPHRVTQAIRKIHDQGGKLNHAAVGHSSLARAAVNLFGSWNAALRAAGLDPEEIRVYRRPWTREEVVAEIRRKHSAGEALNAKDVTPYSLRRTGRVFFGSWDVALAAAGLDPNGIRKKRWHR